MAEFALLIPLMIVLFGGMFAAGLYAFRAASVDWGIFITAAGAGSYSSPATGAARAALIWPDLADQIATSGSLEDRQAMSLIQVENAWPILGLNAVEAQSGSAFFRLWRFYAGPPPAGGIE